jgi:hypothetical protein
MKTKLNLLLIPLFFMGLIAEAQLLEKLKKRAQEKGLETREVSFDTTGNAKNRMASDESEELVINTAKDFFTTDVVMKLYYETNEVIHIQYFDADNIAMRTELPDPSKKPMFHDSKGYAYAFNEKTFGYEKVKLISSGMMGFMTAGMIPQYYKLPPDPYLDAFGKLQEKDISLNFLILELAFIYKPGDFEKDPYYIRSITMCNNSDSCIKFSYNDPEYPGSYIEFDKNGKLTELFINTIRPDIKEEDHPTGKFVYTYQNVNVNLPDAKEQSMIPGPLGEMLNLERGLEPWKHNKKDKKKNNNDK